MRIVGTTKQDDSHKENSVKSVISMSSNPLPALADSRRIAVFRALQVGDMLCAVPALRALRAAAPVAEITLIGLPWAAEFARRFRQYIDDFVPFPGAPGMPEQPASSDRLDAFYRTTQTRGFDLALQLHGDGRLTNAIVRGLGARRVAGSYPADKPVDEPGFVAHPAHEPEVRRLLRVVEALRVPTRGEALEFPIRGDEWKELARLRAAYGLRPGEYACIHPGARLATRRWPPERFAAVADALATRGMRVVLTGTHDEQRLTQAVARATHTGATNLCGQTSLGVLGALYAGARLLVCNDTGVSHLAAALCVPSVVIYSGSDPARWAPLDHERHRSLHAPADCRPCYHSTCPIGHRCALDVTADQVTSAALELMRYEPGKRAAM